MTTPTAFAESGPEPTEAVSPATALALERISVTRPYFALDDLDLGADGVVRATVPPGPPAGREHGAIAADQVARHLAILGSCAAALSRDDDTRHHYLATNADYERMPTSPIDPIGEPLRAATRADWVDKRTARAEMELSTPDGELLNRLVVQYAVRAPTRASIPHPSAEGTP